MSTDAEEEELLTHALALESSQGDGKVRFDNFAYRVTYRRARPILWRIAGHGLMSVKLLARMLPVLVDDVAHAATGDLWAVLGQVPVGIGKLTPCLLDDYPVAVDTMLMNALFREPDSAAIGTLPAHVAAALPLCRQRLGQSDTPAGLSLLRQLVKLQVGYVSSSRFEVVSVTTFEDGRLGHAALGGEVEQLLAFGAAFGPPSVVEGALKAEVTKKRAKPHLRWAGWAAADAASPDPSPQSTLERLRRTPKEDREMRDRLARIAAARFHAAGLPVPEELDEDIVFAFNAPMGSDYRRSTPGWRRAVEELRAFPRDRLLRRFDAVLSRGWAAAPHDYPVAALVAHPDEARMKRLVDLMSWHVGAAGADALSVLLRLIKKTEDKERVDWYQTLAREAFLFVDDIDPAWDDVFDTHLEEYARAFLMLLPPARRDAVITRHLRDDERAFTGIWVQQLDLLSDAGLDAAMPIVVAKRDPKRSEHAIHRAFGRLGARVEAPLRAHLKGRRDRGARIMIDAARISEEAATAILGTAPDPIRVKVIGSIRNGVAFLDSYAARLQSSRPIGKIHLPTGRLAVVSGPGEDSVSALARAVPPGVYPVFGWQKFAEPAVPTAGVFALAVRFSDKVPVTWALDEGFWCEISLCFMDEARGLAESAAMEAELDDALHKCFDEGFVLAGKGPAGSRAALVAYIGEGPDDEKLYWGLDADGAPAIVIAGF